MGIYLACCGYAIIAAKIWLTHSTIWLYRSQGSSVHRRTVLTILTNGISIHRPLVHLPIIFTKLPKIPRWQLWFVNSSYLNQYDSHALHVHADDCSRTFFWIQVTVKQSVRFFIVVLGLISDKLSLRISDRRQACHHLNQWCMCQGVEESQQINYPKGNEYNYR